MQTNPQEFFKSLKQQVVRRCALAQANQALHHMANPMVDAQRHDQAYINAILKLLPVADTLH